MSEFLADQEVNSYRTRTSKCMTRETACDQQVTYLCKRELATCVLNIVTQSNENSS